MAAGVVLRVSLQNVGGAPHVLRVCPAMLMCCVRGQHPLVAFDDTGMGLLDVCLKANPPRHEAFLPKGATFSFDLAIPVSRLPSGSAKAGKRLSVVLCYELPDGGLAYSNVLSPVLVAGGDVAR